MFCPAYLQERFPAVSVTFDDIDWKIDTKRKALVITGNMVRLNANNQSIDVPSIDLAFTTASVIKQMPTAVMIDVDALVGYPYENWLAGRKNFPIHNQIALQP